MIFGYYLWGNTDLNSLRTFRVLCQTSSVWSIIYPWMVKQTKNTCKSLNFILKIFWKFIARKVTVNGERYCATIFNFFLPKMQELDLHYMWFQQDGTTWHTARVTMDLLRGYFGEHFISRSGPVNRPPRSCDLTPLDYFLCN